MQGAVAAGGGANGGGHAPRTALSRGRHFKEDKKFRFVYGRFNAIRLAISVHQRCSVTFKMHKIHF